jgi:phosphoribosylanthranilate isomerase
MIAIPAIDLARGRAVRLLRGEKTKETVYGDPLEFAHRFREAGAKRIHVVNLDGAFEGTATFEAIAAIVRVGVPVEVGGGVRDEAAVGHLLEEIGAAYVVLGTLALRDLEATRRISARWPDRIYLGLDVRSGRARGAGWTDEGTPWQATLAAWRLLPVRGVIATAIERDGTLLGPDLDLLREVKREAGSLRVIASGGVGTLDDLRRLVAEGGFEGVILGRSLYEGRFDLTEARAVLEGG